MAISIVQTLTRKCKRCGAPVGVATLDLFVAEELPELCQRLQREDPCSARCHCGFQTSLDLPFLVRLPDNRDYFCPRVSSDQAEDEADLRRLTRKLERNGSVARDVRWCDRRLLCAALAGERRDGLLLLDNALNVDPLDDASGRERLCSKALGLLNADLTPLLWSRVAVNLADALADGASNVRSTEAALLYTRAIGILPEGGVEWAEAKLALAAALHDSARGADRTFDAIIVNVHDVLRSFAVRAEPDLAAAANQSLANALAARGVSDDYQEALKAGRKAAAHWRRRGDAHALGLVLTDLADVHLGRRDGGRADAEAAEHLARQALDLLDREESPLDWTRAANLLALSLSYDADVGWRAQMSDALALLENALESVDRRKAPLYWARTASNLAEVYLFRGESDRVENVERSVELFRSALSVRALRHSAEDHMTALVGLGVALSDRLRGDPVANHKAAVHTLRRAMSLEAAEGRNRETWANAAANLGVVLSEHPTLAGRKRHIEDAITLLESARRVRAERPNPQKTAFVDNNLGALYLERHRGVPEENALRAVELLSSSAAYYFRRNPIMRARALNNLGRAHEALALLGMAPQRNLAEATRAFRSALRVFDLETFPHDRRGAARNLYNVEYERGRLRSMKRAIAMAAEAARRMFDRAETPDGRLAEVEEDADLFSVLIETDISVRPKDFVAAFEHSEEGRARLLTSEMSGAPPNTPETVPEDLLRREHELLSRLRRIEREVASTERARHVEAAQFAEATRNELERAWDEVSRYPNGRSYVELRRGHGISWERTRSWLSEQPQGTAILEYARVPNGLVSFLVRQGDGEPIVDRVGLTLDDLRLLSRHLEEEVEHFHRNWFSSRYWNDLAEAVLAPVLPFLANVRLLYISPSQELQGIPLHAVEVGGVPLIERFAVAYVPSVGVAARLPASLSKRRRSLATVFGDPTGDLPVAAREATRIGAMLNSRAVLGREATMETVRGAFQKCDVLHFAGHGHFDQAEPMDSGLLCSDGVLTARSLASTARSPSLVVLSGCGTGRVGVRTGEEPYGLARALTSAGVRRTVLSLWDVDEMASLHFMEAFYRKLDASTSAAEALRTAALNCRQRHAYPFFWAPWILQGAP